MSILNVHPGGSGCLLEVVESLLEGDLGGRRGHCRPHAGERGRDEGGRDAARPAAVNDGVVRGEAEHRYLLARLAEQSCEKIIDLEIKDQDHLINDLDL